LNDGTNPAISISGRPITPIFNKFTDTYQFKINKIENYDLQVTLPKGVQSRGIFVNYRTFDRVKLVDRSANKLSYEIRNDFDAYLLFKIPSDARFSFKINGRFVQPLKDQGVFPILPIGKGLNKIDIIYEFGNIFEIWFWIALTTSIGNLIWSFGTRKRLLIVPKVFKRHMKYNQN
jgi:uncharacterized membrane protein YfhO